MPLIPFLLYVWLASPVRSARQTITIPAVTKHAPPPQCDPQQIALLFCASAQR